MSLLLVDETALLARADGAQVAEWIGEDSFVLTKIYEKQPGHTSREFHRAVAGRGPTVTVVEVLAERAFNHDTHRFDNERQIIGAYNPQSWHSAGGWHFVRADIHRTAFLCNLTTGEIQRQNIAGQGVNESGIYQTYNTPERGPTFGGGYDLHIDATLGYGEFYNYSYGGTTLGRNILSGPEHHHSGQMIGAMEVWGVGQTGSTKLPALLPRLMNQSN